MLDVAQVGLVMLGERGGHADDHRVHVANGGEFRRGAEAGTLGFGNLCSGDAHDIGAGGVQRVDLAAIDVEARDGKALLGKQQGEREPDVAHPDDADLRGASGDGVEGGLEVDGFGRDD